MFHSLLTTYNTHPDLSDLLVNSVKSYINSKLDNERKTPEFITEVRRRLYLIHEYKDQVAKLTHAYPRSNKFDLLLVKYVELEFEALYHNNTNPPKQAEVLTELRVLRLLQVMLYQTVLNNETLINENTDAILKKAVLRLLGDVKSSCLVENKLVHNIAKKLLKKVNGRNHEFDISIFDTHQFHRNLVTSDYGTDDNDSDFEFDVHSKSICNRKWQKQKGFASTPDCVEVPLTENGIAPIPTIEFADDDDDDDDYMVYLQQQKKNRDSVSISNNLCNIRKNPDKFIGGNTCDNEKVSAQNKSISKNLSRNSCEDDCVVLSSDEENSSLATPKRKNTYRHKEEKRKDKSNAVVTFELIDDDDDQPTYMMYLQKEVETNKKKHSKATKKLEPEVIICSDSDSEDEAVKASEESSFTCELPSVNTQNLCTNDEDTNDRTKNAQDKTQQIEKESLKNKFDEDTLDDILNFVGTKSFQENANHSEVHCFENDKRLDQNFCSAAAEVIPEVLCTLNIGNMNEETTSHNTSVSSQDSMHLLMLENELEMNFCEENSTNFLIDPAAVFEEIACPSTQSKINTLALNQCCNPCESQQMEASTSNACFEELSIDRPNAPGGPVLSEKMDDPDDLDSLQEHSLNTSILDLFLDDNYLLEGRKQFEELECFLFDDSNKEGSGYYDGINFFCEGNESITQSIVSKDAKNLESLLNESQFCVEDKEICSDKVVTKSCHDSLRKKQKRKCALKRKHKTKKRFEEIKSDVLKNFTNNSPQFHDVFKNLSLTDFLHRTENNFKATGRRKSSKASIR